MEEALERYNQRMAELRSDLRDLTRQVETLEQMQPITYEVVENDRPSPDAPQTYAVKRTKLQRNAYAAPFATKKDAEAACRNPSTLNFGDRKPPSNALRNYNEQIRHSLIGQLQATNTFGGLGAWFSPR